MIKFKLILYVISLFPWSCIATQYLYPVAFKNEHIYCIYQSSAEVIRMVIWDSCAKEIMPGLLPRFMPAGLHLLPNKCGYSFIDEGILHIQKFSKRSPKSLEFYAPIYDINVPEWIDENTGFFTAKVRDHYGIFQFDMNADLACLLINPKKDFMYPQKVGSQLFYIERLKRGLGFQFRLMAIPYPTNVGMQGDNETIVFNSLLSDQLATEILDFHNEPIAFLYMESENSGFFISYPMQIEDDASTIPCSYYRFNLEKNGHWCEQRLFDFIIPSALFLQESSRLYESILPLLPRHLGNNIYFVDCSGSAENLNLNLYEYNRINQSIGQLTYADKEEQHFFGPIIVNSALYCGGSGYVDRLHFIKMV